MQDRDDKAESKSESIGGDLNLTDEEIESALKSCNEKYHVNIKRYTHNGSNNHTLSELNKDINTLKNNESLTAIISLSSHSFAIRIDCRENKKYMIIDDPLSLLNTTDYQESMNTTIDVFAFFARTEFAEFVKSIKNIESISANRQRYQYDAGSCHTFALVNAKQLALNNTYYTSGKVQNCKRLSKDVYFYDATKKHEKYKQQEGDHVKSIYQEKSIFIHKKTDKLRKKAHADTQQSNPDNDEKSPKHKM